MEGKAKGSHALGSSQAYARAGVDIDAAGRLAPILESIARGTYTSGVLSGVGGFAGLFELDSSAATRPVLAASCDGVGTKLKVAQMLGVNHTVGIDCVAMNVDDVVCTGAKPLFFLDYIAVGRHNPELIQDVVAGVAEGCRLAGCALLGGETAQMPGFYDEGEYELAGFAVGVVDREKLIDGSAVSPGDALVGLHSSGLHSNGYSLVRKVLLEDAKMRLEDHVPELGRTLGEELLEPTRIYAPAVVQSLCQFQVHGVAHITGGGLYENLPRVLPMGCRALVRRGSWPEPAVFHLIKEKGGLPWREMFRTFNMGIGMVLIVGEDQAEECARWFRTQGIGASLVGEVVASTPGEVPSVEVEGLN
ncbi:MAG: phosphoribosylformylglycinamidine cyclo-ligase [Bacillota bacterium]